MLSAILAFVFYMEQNSKKLKGLLSGGEETGKDNRPLLTFLSD
jgi:hypothetical protein